VRDLEIIKQILKKYDLMLPVLPREQRKIYRSKRRALAVILGENEKSTLMTTAAVRFYYIMRNMGMPVTLVSGARAAVFASVITLMFFAGGSVLLLQNYFYRQGVIAVNELSQNGIIAASGDIRINRGGTEIVSPGAPYMIMAGDEIITGEFSALLQFDNGAIVKIFKKSSVLVVSLGSHYQIDLRTGSIITRIPQLAEGTGYAIHTPDSVVSVKGTEFGVQYENGKTKVYVTKGTVSVKYLPDGTEYDVAAGSSSEVNGDKKSFPLTEEETLLMKGFSDLQYVESISTKSTVELQSISDKLSASDAVKSGERQSKKMTLEDMKLKYGKLDEVILYSGKKYTGVILSRGGVYKILTAGGVVSVPAKEVKGSGIIQ